MDNLKIYEACRSVPKEAQKTINAGRIKGYTDIDPMWRIKKLTECFGACGIGWYYDVEREWLEKGDDNTICAFVDINLYIKVEGEWSKPIHGTGGNAFKKMEKSGAYVSDECYKMATTDALSVACKQLGIGADVYWGNDPTKYTARMEKPQEEQAKTNRIAARDAVFDYINDCKMSKESINKLCKHYGIGTLDELTDAQALNYIEALIKKGIKING